MVCWLNVSWEKQLNEVNFVRPIILYFEFMNCIQGWIFGRGARQGVHGKYLNTWLCNGITEK